jgi:hypothetical protein
MLLKLDREVYMWLVGLAMFFSVIFFFWGMLFIDSIVIYLTLALLYENLVIKYCRWYLYAMHSILILQTFLALAYDENEIATKREKYIKQF